MPPETTIKTTPDLSAAQAARDAAAAMAQSTSGEPTGVEAEKVCPQYDLLDDCRMMLRFAVKEGFEPDESLRHDIALLDSVLIAAKYPTISEIPADLANVEVGNVAPLAQPSGKI